RREGEGSTSFSLGCGISRVEGRRQKTYDIIEISLIIDASKPGLIRGARMRKRDGDDDQKGQQRDAQARETRGAQAIENRHSRLDQLWSGERDYRVGGVCRQQRCALTVPGSEACAFTRSSWFAERPRLMIRCPRWRAAVVIHSTHAPTTARARCCLLPGHRRSACCR